MQDHDIAIEWTQFRPILANEDDGMEAVDGFSEPLTDWDWESPQPGLEG